jgi:hypothetical protein
MITIAAYGGGLNSTAMIVEAVHRCLPIDLILFSDTGAEKPHTYAYVEMFSKWLAERGYPEVITVQPPTTIIQDCQKRHALPAVAYGYRTCSDRFKIAPQRKYCNNWQPAKDAWDAGEKLLQLVGYDADEPHRAERPIPEDDTKKYENWYPLIDWDMGRDECAQAIEMAGLCMPGKSACYLCPNSQPSEIRQNNHNYPDLMRVALDIEASADLTSLAGLGRRFNWGAMLANDEMFPDGYALTPEMLCGCYDG